MAREVMSWKSLAFVVLIAITTMSCKEDPEEIVLDPDTEILVKQLNQELHPLPQDPLLWGDGDLTFLDQIAESSIVGLGEATHGTSEFFKAKHRIFRYLVEHHGFRVFAFEADFGESLFINDAIQRGAADEIRDLMSEKMHFWTWSTSEVRNLLEWMCNYNVGKADADKVHYLGIDCQFNTFHPTLLKDYLRESDVPFLSSANVVLDEADYFSKGEFKSYSVDEFASYLERLDAVADSMHLYKEQLIERSSEREYELQLRMLRLIRQTSEVRKYQEYSIHFRDQYMAENAIWGRDYYDAKVALWAHNWHVSDYPNYYTAGGSMGHHLKDSLAGDYAIIGFLFSNGSFKAQGTGPRNSNYILTHHLDDQPKTSSINYIMSNAKVADYAVKITDLHNHYEWNSAFNKGLRHFQIGSLYDEQPYYSRFDPDYFQYIIYFDETTESGYFR